MKILKYLFIFGFILVLSSLVIPDSYTGDARIDEIRNDTEDDVPLLLFYTFWYGLHIVFIILAIQHPKRSVFLSGSIIAGFVLLAMIFRSGIDVELSRLMYAFGYMLILTGYFIKPPKSNPKPVEAAENS